MTGFDVPELPQTGFRVGSQRDETDLVIAVSPTSSAVGQIVDEQGLPTAGFRFRYAIKVTYPNGSICTPLTMTCGTTESSAFARTTRPVNGRRRSLRSICPSKTVVHHFC